MVPVLFNDYKSKLGYESKNSNGPIYFFITILYFLNDKACMSYDHGSLNRRPGGLCVIGELYALLLSYKSLLLGDEILSNLLTSFHFTPFNGCKRSVCGP